MYKISTDYDVFNLDSVLRPDRPILFLDEKYAKIKENLNAQGQIVLATRQFSRPTLEDSMELIISSRYNAWVDYD